MTHLSTALTRRATLPLALAAAAFSAASSEPPLHPVGADTLWYGGVDPTTGLAVEGGIWDFDGCTTQGWTSRDLTGIGPFFTHVTAESIAAHGDPVSTVITSGSSTGSMWCGVHEDEAQAECWPGGMGYSNDWRQALEKTFPYGGSGDVTIAFDYFTDLESGFDYAFVYVRRDDGERLGPLNTSVNSPLGVGYTGGTHEDDAIGTPDAPARDTLLVEASALGTTGSFDVVFLMDSDRVVSDGWPVNPVAWQSTVGAFGLDDVIVSGAGLADTSDFEPGGTPGEETDGWIAYPYGEVGALLAVRPLGELEPFSIACPMSGCVLTAAAQSGVTHPVMQREWLTSNAVALDTGDALVVTGDVRNDVSHSSTCLTFYVRLRYYPWTCPTSGETSWSPHPPIVGGASEGECERIQASVPMSGSEPGALDSVQVILEVDRPWDPWADCNPNAEVGTPPFWDNLRVGVVRTPVATPSAAPDVAPVRVHVPTPLGDGGAIEIELPEPVPCTVSIYDVAGRLVGRVASPARRHVRLAWAGVVPGAAPGVYFLRVDTAADAVTRRIVHTR